MTAFELQSTAGNDPFRPLAVLAATLRRYGIPIYLCLKRQHAAAQLLGLRQVLRSSSTVLFQLLTENEATEI